MIKRLWSWFWSPTSRYTWGAILLVGCFTGIVFWGGFNTFMEYTNTMKFCVSCHEMSTPFEEYKKSAHFRNASGVRAICSDCHVPKEWTPKLIRKIRATNELYHKFIGSIDTKEKFEAKRLELAENVWASMTKTDSRECRNCHSYVAMDFHKQNRRAAKKMQEGLDKGKTCIDCHKGVAHKLPEGFEDEED